MSACLGQYSTFTWLHLQKWYEVSTTWPETWYHTEYNVE